MIHNESIIERIRQILNSARSDGERVLEDGTWLVSPAPEIAPQAWHHVLFAPALSFDEIDEMETALNARFPDDLRGVFLKCNGFRLFGGKISLWGKRRTWERSIDKAWQPFDMIDHNREAERPLGSPSETVFIASLEGGSKLAYFEIFSEGRGGVGMTHCKSFSPLKKWPNFNSWIQEMLDTNQDPELIVKDSIG